MSDKKPKPRVNWRKRSEQQANDILALEATVRSLNRRCATLAGLLNAALNRDAEGR